MAPEVRLLKRHGTMGSFLSAHRRSFVAVLVGLSASGLGGCSSRSGREAGTAPVVETPGPEQAPAPEADPGPPPERQVPDLFKRGRTYEVNFSGDLMKKVPAQLSRSELSTFRIPVTFSPNDQLWLSVDQHAPRPVGSSKLTVASLLTEDVELAPGAHWLIGWRRDGDEKLLIQTHAFFVEVEPQGLPRAPGCLVATPALTVNGPRAAASIPLVALPLMAGIDRVEVRAQGEGFESLGEAPPATEMMLESPPSGDIELSIRCFTGNEERGTDAQMITVNADAPDPAPKASP